MSKKTTINHIIQSRGEDIFFDNKKKITRQMVGFPVPADHRANEIKICIDKTEVRETKQFRCKIWNLRYHNRKAE